MTTTCRFCLEDSASPDNPFLSPCDCKGSVQHVHLECLRRWRTATDVDAHRTQCQMCNRTYNLPRRWPREIWTGPDGSYVWSVLSQWAPMTILVYYVHMSALMYFIPEPIVPAKRAAAAAATAAATSTALQPLLLQQQMDYAYQHERDNMLARITSAYGTNLFLAILGVLTIVYGAYYLSLFARIVNKRRYVLYWVKGGAHIQFHPLRWAAIATGVLLMTRHFIAPFGGLYVYYMAYYMQIHRTIVRQIEVDGDVL